MGIDVIRGVPGATGDYSSDLRLAPALDCLTSGRFDFTKAAGMLRELWDSVAVGTTIAVTADHSTPCAVGDHTCDPVPFCVATKGVDVVTQFDEFASARGGLGRFIGSSMLDVALRNNGGGGLRSLILPPSTC